MAKTDVDYRKTGTYNKKIFVENYTDQFRAVPKYNAASIPDLVRVMEMMEQDPRITDIRWMAYMLATAYHESSSTVRISTKSKNRKGHMVVRTAKVWRNFAPVEEKGHGRKYHYGRPVKVDQRPDGTVAITEYDGEQWTVLANGPIEAAHKHQKHGTAPHAKASHAYLQAGGEELLYDGRGFVQLTWWDNYTRTGFMIGRGLDLLLDPDSVCEPEVAYQILSTGMLTGGGFANGRTFRQFFDDSHTDYVHARSMVNGVSGQDVIAGYGERFERVLLACGSAGKPASS